MIGEKQGSANDICTDKGPCFRCNRPGMERCENNVREKLVIKRLPHLKNESKQAIFVLGMQAGGERQQLPGP